MAKPYDYELPDLVDHRPRISPETPAQKQSKALLILSMFTFTAIYPGGGKFLQEVIFAFSRIAKIAKFCAS